MTDLQKRFEAFARTWNPVLSLAKQANGEYYDVATTWALEIWQAAQPSLEKIEAAARRIFEDISFAQKPEHIAAILREELGGGK